MRHLDPLPYDLALLRVGGRSDALLYHHVALSTLGGACSRLLRQENSIVAVVAMLEEELHTLRLRRKYKRRRSDDVSSCFRNRHGCQDVSYGESNNTHMTTPIWPSSLSSSAFIAQSIPPYYRCKNNIHPTITGQTHRYLL